MVARTTFIQQELKRKVYVLAVDDQEKNLISLQQLLNSPDLEVVTALSGREALKKILRYEFSCILLDIRMPEMDGFECADIIRADREFSHIPIIFVTAEAKDQEAIFQGYHSGAVDFLIKPLSPMVLTAKVRVFADLFRQKKALDKSQLIEELYAQLKDSNEQLKQYTHIASHDLREPVRRMRTLVDLLLVESDESHQEGIADLCSDLRNCTSEMLKLVDNFRELTQILDSDEVFAETDLDACIDKVLLERADEIQARKIKIIRETHPKLVCHGSFVTEMLRCLLDNALVHTGDQSIEIRFTAEQKQQLWVMGVYNSGSTIDSRRTEDIFKPFSRLTSRQKWEHIGLGLTKVKKIIEHHQGSIQVETYPDGVCFKYTLSGRTHD